jgi:hypothetical protein
MMIIIRRKEKRSGCCGTGRLITVKIAMRSVGDDHDDYDCKEHSDCNITDSYRDTGWGVGK